MEDPKVVFASNLISLRTKANLTQVQLANMINYSDKSISKWERAEALPDLLASKKLAECLGTTVDYFLVVHDEWTPDPPKSSLRRNDQRIIIHTTILGTALFAALIFIICWILGQKLWIIPLVTLPIMLIILLILNSLWNKGRKNVIIAMSLVFSIFVVIYFSLLKYNPWPLLIVFFPAEALVLFGFTYFRTKK